MPSSTWSLVELPLSRSSTYVEFASVAPAELPCSTSAATFPSGLVATCSTVAEQLDDMQHSKTIQETSPTSPARFIGCMPMKHIKFHKSRLSGKSPKTAWKPCLRYSVSCQESTTL